MQTSELAPPNNPAPVPSLLRLCLAWEGNFYKDSDNAFKIIQKEKLYRLSGIIGQKLHQGVPLPCGVAKV